MIVLPPDAAARPPLARYGLDVLVDLSRVVPATPDLGDAVRLRVEGEEPDSAALLDPARVRSFAEREWTLRAGDGAVTIDATALAALGAVAGTVAEQRSAARDRHERVPAAENLLVRASLERSAVVSRAAAMLRAAVVRASGGRRVLVAVPWPQGRRWAAAFTHDLDAVAAWPVFTALRVAELARKGALATAARTATAAVAAIGRAPIRRAALELLDTERKQGIRGTWFVLCGTPTLRTMRRGDLTYTPESTAARRIIGAVSDDGHEIGLHGSFDTTERDALLREQRTRLARLAREPVAGVRQHYLRMRQTATPRAMAAAGFAYDSTCGFPDRNGFRAGVADVFSLWDDGASRTLELDEAPFVWMDRALSKYRDVEDPDVWVDDAIELAAECAAVEGLWTGIWHPNLSPPLGFPDAPEAYARLARSIVERGAYVAPLRELVAWRVARRALRVVSVAPDGRPRVASPTAAPEGLALEDAHGRPVTDVDWC